MIPTIARGAALAISLIALAGCSSGSPSTFNLGNASVDQSYTCPVGASNAHYDVHGTIDANNPTSQPVLISTVDATFTLASVKGGWLEKVGDKYVPSQVTFTPATVGAGASTTIAVTIPSACTGRSASATVASGDYAVSFKITTTAGTFKLDSKDRHRITTA
ncbi:MAG TPA: hypothetical protein VLR46_13730 [Candidatus Dormibacteraeota bacterium]|nr:hypothetical protein [Candidatus Dormibacteraeota bacterium]